MHSDGWLFSFSMENLTQDQSFYVWLICVLTLGNQWHRFLLPMMHSARKEQQCLYVRLLMKLQIYPYQVQLMYNYIFSSGVAYVFLWTFVKGFSHLGVVLWKGYTIYSLYHVNSAVHYSHLATKCFLGLVIVWRKRFYNDINCEFVSIKVRDIYVLQCAHTVD